jgi:Tol biopolymer transport system component
MRLRLLATWIALAAIAGLAGAFTRGNGPAGDAIAASGSAPAARELPRGGVPSASTTTIALTPATEPSIPPTAPPAATEPGPPAAGAPTTEVGVAAPATATEAGVYVVHRDGSGLRKVLDGCLPAQGLTWFDDDELLVPAGDDSTVELFGVDGARREIRLPEVTDRFGHAQQLRASGTPSSDGNRLVLAFGGSAGGYGVAVVDRASGAATVIESGESPTPSWSPTGDAILLVGHDATKLVSPDGTTIRDWTPAAISSLRLDGAWSPDGQAVLSTARADPNSWVVLDVARGSITSVPRVGKSINLVAWAGSGTLLVADAGTAHGESPTVHRLDLATGVFTQIADRAWNPRVSVDGQVVAFQDRELDGTIGLMGVDGRGRSTLARPAEGLALDAGLWSPAGTWLAFDACPS